MKLFGRGVADRKPGGHCGDSCLDYNKYRWAVQAHHGALTREVVTSRLSCSTDNLSAQLNQVNQLEIQSLSKPESWLPGHRIMSFKLRARLRITAVMLLKMPNTALISLPESSVLSCTGVYWRLPKR